LEAARLDGVRLASREMAHLLNNDLAVAIGLLDLLRDRTELPDNAQDLVTAVMESLESAARHVAQFQDVTRVATRETPVGPSLDLERSRAAS
jgi:signal transduction histidine kinase